VPLQFLTQCLDASEQYGVGWIRRTTAAVPPTLGR
jgi:hypothetical protein